jgi:hypothetical protein
MYQDFLAYSHRINKNIFKKCVRLFLLIFILVVCPQHGFSQSKETKAFVVGLRCWSWGDMIQGIEGNGYLEKKNST